MSGLGVANANDNLEFKWGTVKGIGRQNKDIEFYDSFTFQGVEYFLYDCVYLNHFSSPDAYIGKLVKIYETPTHEKKVKIVWFFRPMEIRNFLANHEPRWNEIFLASGEGKGVSNINFLEAINGKCNVVCVSKDSRNPPASEAELNKADYFFYRTYDVGTSTISENFTDRIDGIKVEHFFNKKKDKMLTPSPKPKAKWTVKSSLYSKSGLDKVVGNVVSDGMSGHKVSPVVKELKKTTASMQGQGHFSNEDTTLRPLTSLENDGTGPGETSCRQLGGKTKVRLDDELLPTTASDMPHKKRKILLDHKNSNRIPSKRENFNEKASTMSEKASSQIAGDKGIKIVSRLIEVTRRPAAEKRNWFKQLPWGQRLQTAQETGTLVLLENLDPSFTSAEVEDIVWSVFNERVDAKMIQGSAFSSPHYGKAFVIFKSKVAAETVISHLDRRCLMVADGRPVVGRIGTLGESSSTSSFAGHLIIDRGPRMQREEMRNAVSTAHCSQPNTLEYDMAMEWRILQEKTDLWWNKLHEMQAKQIEEVKCQKEDCPG